MKTVIALFLLLPLTANAVDVETCLAASPAAEKVMTMRQNGFSMAEMIRVLEGNEFGIELVKRAFKEPHWNSEERKQRAILDFTNDFTRECLEVAE